jgi:phage-related protein
MSLTLDSALIDEKNRLHSRSPWVWLLSITLPDTTTLYFARNVDAVTYGGNVYNPTYFGITGLEFASDGAIPRVRLRVANPGRLVSEKIEPDIEGQTVTLIKVHTGNLSADYTDLTQTFSVVGAEDDDEYVYLRLGPPNLLNRDFPLHELRAYLCDHVFQDLYCADVSAFTECDGSIADCLERQGDLLRWGAEFGLQERRYVII